jgi:DNA-binding CsgD family transcriptional regulator
MARTDPGDAAATRCAALLGLASDAGDEAAASILHRDLAWVAVLVGRWSRADDHLRRALPFGLGGASVLGIRAFLAGLRGREVEAAELATEASVEAERSGSLEGALLARSAVAASALARGDPAIATDELAPAWDLHRAAGIGEPSLFPFVADLAEASIEAGRLETAREVTAWLEERGRALDRPWAIGAGARCRGLLASSDDLDRSMRSLDEALAVHEDLAWPFEVARTLHCLGAVHRRAKRKKAARDALERAAGIFDDLGAPVWAGRSRAEEARIGGRRASGGDLTEAERRVYRLVLAGLSNRAIADALFMSVRTVEGHVSRILRKLGARTRAELIAFHDPDREDEPGANDGTT